MIWLLLGLLCTDTGSEVVYGGTNIFERLRPEEVAIADNGEVYLLNFAERKVIRYDASGKQLASFGGKGEGPGEFGHPAALFVDAERVYVTDLGRDCMHSFKRDGQFEKTLSLPATGLQLVRVKGGWVHANTMDGDPNTPIDVIWVDDNFTNAKTLLSIPRGPGRGLRVEMNGSNNRPVVKFNPVSDGPNLVGSRDGLTVFVRPTGGFHVYVFDAVSRTLLREIKREDQGVPFNEEFGNERLNKIKEDMERRHSPVELKAAFPDRFPPVREMSCDGDGHLLVRRWTGRPDKDENYLILDREGKEQPLPCKAEYLARLVELKDGTAYLTACTEDDEAYVVRAPLAQLAQVLKAHANAGEAKPRMLMRTN